MNEPESIVIHHSTGKDRPMLPDAESVRNFHINVRGYRDVGYHYLVELVDGRPVVRFGRKPWDVGAHCPGYNRSSLGVCIIGNFMGAEPSAPVLACAADLVTGLCVAHHIPANRVYGHREVSQRPTACPGDKFPIERFRNMVESALAARYGVAA